MVEKGTAVHRIKGVLSYTFVVRARVASMGHIGEEVETKVRSWIQFEVEIQMVTCHQYTSLSPLQ
jgi:hypothetical protein